MTRRSLATGILLILAGIAQAGAASSAAPGIHFAPCRLEHPTGLASVEAQCGHLAVPENRQLPGGRQVQLFVARLPALSRQSSPVPLFIVAGGPGLGASVFYASAAPVFARIRLHHDIIVVDQRGTGRSSPLDCQFDEQQLWDAGEEETARVMRQCREQLAADHDVAQYTTSVAVRDLDAVRAALRYPHIALYGSSYGTRVAQHYARRYPAQTQAVILDGVVPPQQVLGTTTPLDAERALDRVFARCRADAACTDRFGDSELDYQQLRERLGRSSVPLTLPDPRSGLPRQLEFSGSVLTGALRLATYGSEQAALLPLALHLANHDANYAPLAAQFLLAASSYDAVLAYGMHNSVVCTEDVPFYDTAGIDHARLAATFLGTAQLDALRALCAEWPRGPMDADLHQPLHSESPALILSGTADPVTPPEFGDQAALGFHHALHLQLKDQGHGQLAEPCIDRIMADFVDTARPGAALKLETACIGAITPAPFFLSMDGPGP